MSVSKKKLQNTGLREQEVELSLCLEDLREGLNAVVPTMMRQNYTAISVVCILYLLLTTHGLIVTV